MCKYVVAFNPHLNVLSHAIQSTIVPFLIYSVGGGYTFETPCILLNIYISQGLSHVSMLPHFSVSVIQHGFQMITGE